MNRLPPGPHGRYDQFAAPTQRERLIVAVSQCLYEHGYEGTTVSAVGRYAHVSKSDFYRHFSSKDGCFLAAYDEGVKQVRVQVLGACEGRDEWAERVCAGLRALLEFFATEPAQANLLLVEGLRGSRGVPDRYQEAVRSFVPHLRDGAPSFAGGGQPGTTDEAVVGGVASLVGRRVLAGETERLAGFLPEVSEFALTPYLGAAEARRIISAG